jgi:hypothetical protein
VLSFVRFQQRHHFVQYNGDEIATIDGIGSRTDFNYTNGLITKIVTIDKATQGSKTLEYSYNTDQLIQLSPNNYVIKYTQFR